MKVVLTTTLATWLLAAAAAVPVAASAAESIAQVFQRVGGAVVVVRTQARAAAADDGGRAQAATGIGSGVLISADGKVLTAAHVVQTADAIVVDFANGERAAARVLAAESAADLALLQLERVPAGATVARLGDSDRAQVGDQVFVVGAPLGITHTLTVGHLSARRRAALGFGGPGVTELFQTDAAINPGNSGGPMFDRSGAVIGVVSHIVSRGGGSEGLGFVVTSNVVRKLLFEERSVWSGLEGIALEGPLARAFNLPGDATGLLVQRVASNSPAARLGLRGGEVPAVIDGQALLLGGDVVLAVDGIALGAPDAYEQIRRRLVQRQRAREAVAVRVLRAGRIVELHLGGGPAVRAESRLP